MIAPAMPVVIQKKKTFVSLFGLDVNSEFKYKNYFSVLPTGPRPKNPSPKASIRSHWRRTRSRRRSH
ncbi:MAG: hypothetical protein WDN48_00260 [Pseudolabrys sp.]